jgi:hypothetical protein
VTGDAEIAGQNSRLDDLQAAILRVKLVPPRGTNRPVLAPVHRTQPTPRRHECAAGPGRDTDPGALSRTTASQRGPRRIRLGSRRLSRSRAGLPRGAEPADGTAPHSIRCGLRRRADALPLSGVLDIVGPGVPVARSHEQAPPGQPGEYRARDARLCNEFASGSPNRRAPSGTCARSSAPRHGRRRRRHTNAFISRSSQVVM